MPLIQLLLVMIQGWDWSQVRIASTVGLQSVLFLDCRFYEGMLFSENAQLISATALHDLITSRKHYYDTISDHLSQVLPQLIPLP